MTEETSKERQTLRYVYLRGKKRQGKNDIMEKREEIRGREGGMRRKKIVCLGEKRIQRERINER